MSRRAKIVCTLGPAVATPDRVRALVDAGMDVARLNFSHGSHEDHARACALVRAAAESAGRSVAVLADLQGPKIRLGRFAAGPVEWDTGDRVVITTDRVAGTRERVSTTYPGLPGDVRPGDRLLIDDGNLELSVTDVTDTDVCCQVVEGGPVSDNKGISLPGISVTVPALSDKDADDLRFALGLPVDLVALSFVRAAKDIVPVHAVMDAVGVRRPVIAKLERPEAVAALDEVVSAFDAVMVARGDLGVELPLEEVPLVQKRIVQVCREKARPVIVATQMLESMIEAARPTRAEASDVANAVLDGADAVMLSGETSVGKYPIQAVETMARIVCSVENGRVAAPELRFKPATQGGAIARAAKEIGEYLGATALVAFTVTGDTVRRLARHHPELPVLAFTPHADVRAQLTLSWGVDSYLVPRVEHTDDMVRQVDAGMLETGAGNPGDLVVIVAGSPPGTPGTTNLIRLHRLGSVDDCT